MGNQVKSVNEELDSLTGPSQDEYQSLHIIQCSIILSLIIWRYRLHLDCQMQEKGLLAVYAEIVN